MKKLNHTLYTGGNFFACVFYFTAIFLMFYSCKKDVPLKEETYVDCNPILPCNKVTIGGGHKLVGYTNFVGIPHFNPNNDNEFSFLERTDSSLLALYTFDLISKEKKLLHTSKIWYSPQWGKNDWILFGQNDANIYKIKSNGDSLTQLTNLGNLHHPIWNQYGNKFLAFTSASNMYSLIFDMNGSLLDTIYYGQTNTADIQNPNYIVSNNYFKVTFFNLNKNSIEYVYDYSKLISSLWGTIFWLNNTEVIYSNINGLNRLSIPSLKNQNFKKSCNAKMYIWGAINSSKTKMIWTTKEYTQIDECTLTYKNRTYIMNVDGSDEREIDLN